MTGSLEDYMPADEKFYSYDEYTWGDLLTSYDGKPITYDEIGNPLSYGTWTYTWEHGRELATMSSNGVTWTNTYDADGMRTQRSNGSTTYRYVYNGSSLSQMTVGNDTLYFAYGANGTPMSVTYNNTTYYYVTNLQGDVIAILNAAGTAVVTYTYDAWGNVLPTGGEMRETLGFHNPLRYRGYVYDTETGFYYLQSRYYDPEIGRWINADIPETLTADFENFAQYNLFAYCFNNPVNMSDSSGNWPIPIKLTAEDIEEFFQTLEGFLFGAAISLISSHDLNHRPNRGAPGSVFTAPNGDQRGYGEDGLPEWDYDHDDHGEKDKPRDEKGGHYHDWDWKKEKPRGDAHTMRGIGIVGGILMVLEYLLVYSMY